MEQTVTPEILEVMEAVHYRPAVSVIIPFEPKMTPKEALWHSLKSAAAKVGHELKDNYPGEIGKLVMNKLENIFSRLNFNTHKKSVAIYVSPVFEKVLYLDISVEEKVIVNESFEIRDLVFSKKQLHKYLVLLLSANESKIYLGNTDSFVKIISNTPESVAGYMQDMPERVANFSDMSEKKEILIDKFLHYIDNSLDTILKAYKLPLFVMGTDKILGHFKKFTKHSSAVVEYIHGNYEEATLLHLRDVLEPHLADWKKVRVKELLNQMEEAAGRKKLATGIRDVWREAMNHKGRLLLVEKNYMYPAQNGSNADRIYAVVEPYNKFSYIKDAVDDVIERVLEDGGDVEFVDDALLGDQHHIALIQYF